MELKIHSLEGTKFEGDVHQVSLPTTSGEITVLKDHIPLITTLKKGVIKCGEVNIPVEGGFAEVTKDKVVVLVG